MAILKCKMCGGDLDIGAETTVVECEYCGTKQTVPNVDDEKKITLFGRANRLRFACEFDKAAGVYESIIADFPEEAEAYWGLVLCKYGIEYVDDPATAKKIPTCHRSSFDPVMDDSNFDLVLENADVVARSVYREEAKQIEELRKGIIEVSSKEEPYDIFICYKETAENGDRTVDSVIAQDVYTELVDKGYRVFFSRITLEDELGQEYEPYIFAALNSAKIMLAFGTNYEYYNAVWVKNEWSRFLQLIASGEKKTLIPCYKDIDAYDMPKEFAKLQAQDMGKVGAIQDLLRGIEKILPRETAKTETVVIQQSASNPTVDSYLERAFMFLEDEKWEEANEYCEKALDIDPKCAKAYLGKMMADLKISTEKAIKECKTPLEENTNYEKILKFADDELVEKIKEYNTFVICNPKYQEAKAILNKANASIFDYKNATSLLEGIVGYKDSKELLGQVIKKIEIARSEEKKIFDAVKNTENTFSEIDNYPVALKTDGTIISVNEYYSEEIDTIKTWYNLIKVVGYDDIVIGLKNDGTVVAIGDLAFGEYDVSNWKGIIDIAFSREHIVGLKSDGTVVATGNNADNQCDVSEWKDVAAIGVDILTTYALKKDGTIICTGNYNKFEKYNNVMAFSKPEADYVLLDDGTVAGKTEYKAVWNWNNMIALSCNSFHVVGLKSDGTVVAAGNNDDGQCDVSNWSNIISVYAGMHSTYGIKSDGTIVVAGSEKEYASELNSWKLFNDIDNYKQEQKELLPIGAEKVKKFIEEQRIVKEQEEQRLKEERRNQNLCQHCGGTFKGLFTKKCSSCGKEKDY